MDDVPARLPRTAVAVLVAGPLLMLAGRVLAVPFDDQDWDGVLTQAAAHQGRSDSGWLLAVAAAGLLGSAAATSAQLLREADHGSRAAVVAVTTALGWAGAAGICVAGLVFSVMGGAADRAEQVQVLEDLDDGSTQYVFLLCVLGAVGYVVLARGLALAGLVGRGGAVLVGLGGAGTLLCVPGPVPALAVALAVLLLAGHVLLARSVAGARTEVREAEPERAAR